MYTYSVPLTSLFLLLAWLLQDDHNITTNNLLTTVSNMNHWQTYRNIMIILYNICNHLRRNQPSLYHIFLDVTLRSAYPATYVN